MITLTIDQIPRTKPWPPRSNRLLGALSSPKVDLRGNHVTPSLNERFVSGDPEAVRELYRDYGRPLYGAVYRIVGDHGLAEEAVQQTFLKAWRAAHRFDVDRDIAPWLFTIAKRVAVDIYRRERRHTAEELGERDVGYDGTGIETTFAIFEVRKAMEGLADEEKAVLAATHFAGLSHQQAAAQLGVPPGTVKSRAYRAYRKLESALAHMREVSA